MKIQFKNKEGETEILLEEQRRCPVLEWEVIEFNMCVRHDPFTVEMPVEFSLQEIESLQRAFEEMKQFRRYEASFVSFHLENAVHLKMEPTGHIHAKVSISAGSRGSMRFDFEFDQSFLDGIMNSSD